MAVLKRNDPFELHISIPGRPLRTSGEALRGRPARSLREQRKGKMTGTRLWLGEGKRGCRLRWTVVRAARSAITRLSMIE